MVVLLGASEFIEGRWKSSETFLITFVRFDIKAIGASPLLFNSPITFFRSFSKIYIFHPSLDSSLRSSMIGSLSFERSNRLYFYFKIFLIDVSLNSKPFRNLLELSFHNHLPVVFERRLSTERRPELREANRANKRDGCW